MRSFVGLFFSKIFLFVSVSAFTTATLAAPDFKKIESKDFRFLSGDDCQKEYARHELEKASSHKKFASRADDAAGGDAFEMFKWTPEGISETRTSARCQPEILEGLLRKDGASAKDQARSLRKYFNACGPELTRDAPSDLEALFWIMNTEYPLCKHSGIRKFVARLKTGDVLRGFLALKTGSTPRPLVIVKCGVLCNAGDLSHRFLLMHLFDESPFHVLALGNVTGADFVRDNGHISLGGLDEARQVIELAHFARSGALGKIVSSVHYAGVSLAGQAAFFASAMSPENAPPGAKHALSSAVALCPVVDLKGSMGQLFEDSFEGEIARYFYDTEVLKVTNLFPMLKGLFPSNDDASSVIPERIAKAAVAHYSSLDSPWAPAPFAHTKVESVSDLWKANDFFAAEKNLKTPLKTPTLVIAAEDDRIVRSKINALRLSQAEHGDQLGVVMLPQGSHCAFNQVYGWQTMSALLRGFVLSHSPETLKKKKARTLPVASDSLSEEMTLDEGEKYIGASFRFKAGEPGLHATVRIFSPWLFTCDGQPAENAPDECYRETEELIPFDELESTPSWAQTPSSDVEAATRTRWANANLRLVHAKEAGSLHKASRETLRFHWVTYE